LGVKIVSVTDSKIVKEKRERVDLKWLMREGESKEWRKCGKIFALGQSGWKVELSLHLKLFQSKQHGKR
jgi:hypothetical protein